MFYYPSWLISTTMYTHAFLFFLEPQIDLSIDLGGTRKPCMAGAIPFRLWRHVLTMNRLWRHVLMTSYFPCFGSFYFVFTLYRFKKKFMSPILCSISKIWTFGWRSHGNIKLGKPRLIFPCDRQPSVHIFDMEHNGWHNRIFWNLRLTFPLFQWVSWKLYYGGTIQFRAFVQTV